MTLLEIAKNQKLRYVKPKKYTAQEIELLFAYINGTISQGQAVRALNLKSNNMFYTWALNAIIQACNEGKIKIS